MTFEYGSDWLGCGQVAHDPDCLCDVVLDENRSTSWIADAVNDVYMGSQICEIRNYGVPWTREKLADYLCDLRTFNDVLLAQQQTFDFEYASMYDVPQITPEANGFVRYSLITENVIKCMERFPYPLTYILRKLDVSADEFIASATRNKCRNGWTYAELDSLEQDIMERLKPWAEIANKYGITVDTLKGIRKYWECRLEEYVSRDNEIKSYMHKLCLTTDMTPKEICNDVYEKYGFMFARSSISKFRSRHRLKAKEKQVII